MRVMVSEFKGQLEFFLQPQMMAELAKGLPSSPEMLVPALLSFLGEKVSQSWHFREHQHWAKTDCVRTYDTLVIKDISSDSSCLPCHTPRHCSPKNTNPQFEILQCESCHGSAESHSDPCKEPEGSDEDNCPQHHNPIISPNFNDDIRSENLQFKSQHTEWKIMKGNSESKILVSA